MLVQLGRVFLLLLFVCLFFLGFFCMDSQVAKLDWLWISPAVVGWSKVVQLVCT